MVVPCCTWLKILRDFKLLIDHVLVLSYPFNHLLGWEIHLDGFFSVYSLFFTALFLKTDPLKDPERFRGYLWANNLGIVLYWVPI